MTVHRHNFPAGAGHNRRCAICDCDDREALIDELAAQLWQHRPGERLDETTWEAAGEYWHDAFRQYARAAVNLLKPAR